MLFERLRSEYSEEEIVELTCTVAFENFLSKFHRALRCGSTRTASARCQARDWAEAPMLP
jgi:hypothetical protein